ncbi:putative cationic amino acid transporter [Cavenderia fasciculata]|uniref:Cationic amino acid transporter n=1 Tax=Cavenderia fasciculata TaxID=261658 RepID=F4PKF8_CACFS|nr:putative cationic amino acid transporter [Cavenderia fasciculata]EGG24082.1 putative cationic amino acid transporter [Cavenderia fasciculata]|eukprot:XP_004361933.1 putative cationic amino acid transporter [Cavenderia fasciculata]
MKKSLIESDQLLYNNDGRNEDDNNNNSVTHQDGINTPPSSSSSSSKYYKDRKYKMIADENPMRGGGKPPTSYEKEDYQFSKNNSNSTMTASSYTTNTGMSSSLSNEKMSFGTRCTNRIYTFGQLSKRKKSLEQLQREMADSVMKEESMISSTSESGSSSNVDEEDEEGQVSSEPRIQGQDSKKFKKCLSVFDLLAFGIGAIIGSGIFVLTGVAAKEKAGPAVILSYAVSGIACALSGLCYAEFATRVPCSGSTYSYSYIVVGELVAWIIGWDLTLEYMIASATVARGWSGYLNSIIVAGGGYLPHPFAPFDIGNGFSVDIIAFFSVILLTVIVAFGMKESARFNKIFVVIKIAIVLFVIVAGSVYADTKNWEPFAPYGANGVFNAAAITFFAYLGFDGVCNVAEEVKNPQRDLPIGILGSLGISTILYMLVAVVLTLMVPYSEMDISAPLSQAFSSKGLQWASIIVSIGAFAGLTTAQLSGLLSQPRLYYSLSRDGLLPKWMSHIHPRFKTPFYSTIFTGVCAAIIALFVDINILADMVSIGTLLSFTLVSTCVLIMRYPSIDHKSQSNAKWIVRDFPVALQRPMYLCMYIAVFGLIAGAGVQYSLHYSVIIVFGVLMLLSSAVLFFLVPSNIPTGFKCPWVPLLPILSIWANMYLMISLSWGTWMRLVVWLFIGLLIYVFYGQKRSHLGKEQELNTLANRSSDNHGDLSASLHLKEKEMMSVGTPTTNNNKQIDQYVNEIQDRSNSTKPQPEDDEPTQQEEPNINKLDDENDQ